jgi:ribosome-associated heat shock protein Hsp15
VRLMHAGQTRRLEKPSAELAAGDALVFSQRGALIAVRVEALPHRRGPPAEARALYSDLDAGGLA